MQIEQIKIAALQPAAKNARTHTDDQITQIAKSIEAFGFNVPVLIGADDVLIAGHARVQAAAQVGLSHIPAIRLVHLNERQRQAFMLADNRIALNGGWDKELLADALADVSDYYDLDSLGFDALELDELLGVDDDSADNVPRVPDAPVSRLGDIYQLGAHRVVCGDATIKQNVADAFGTAHPHLMVTDPPYGVNYNPDWRNKVKGANATRVTGKVLNDDCADWYAAWNLFPGDVAYVWHSSFYPDIVLHGFARTGFSMRAHIVWVKSRPVLSRGHYHYQHEPCFYFVRKGKKGHWNGSRRQHSVWQEASPTFAELRERVEAADASVEELKAAAKTKRDDFVQWLADMAAIESDVWHIAHMKNDTGHGTQKPVMAMRRPMENNSKRGDYIYDPFLGSGTTLIAAEQAGRVCCGLELNPAYVDVIVKRWEDYTGKRAEQVRNAS